MREETEKNRFVFLALKVDANQEIIFTNKNKKRSSGEQMHSVIFGS